MLKRILSKAGYEVWTEWNSESQTYELYTDDQKVGYVGFGDTMGDALAVAADWVSERIAD